MTGLGVSRFNPKVVLLSLALLPQFTNPAAPWPLAAQIAALGSVHLASCAVVCTASGTGARRVLRVRPLTRVSGAAMVAIGVGLLAELLVG